MARRSMKQGFAKYTSQINKEDLILKGKFCDPIQQKKIKNFCNPNHRDFGGCDN